MQLYHGTASANIQILDEGLVPRRDGGNWTLPTQVKSLEGMVYLSSSLFGAEFHATRTALKTQSDCLVVSVDPDTNNLYPDENYFARSHIIYVPELEEAQAKVLKNKDVWIQSIETRQAAAHMGVIPAERIVSHKILPVEESIFFPFIKGRDHTLEEFDNGFNAFLHLQAAGLNDNLREIDRFEKVGEYSYRTHYK